MFIQGVTLSNSTLTNLKVSSGPIFPSGTLGQLFYKTVSDGNGTAGFYIYSSTWTIARSLITSATAFVNVDVTLPIPTNDDIFYKTVSDGNGTAGFYTYASGAWYYQADTFGNNLLSQTQFPTSPAIGQICYKTLASGGFAVGLYEYNGSTWVTSIGTSVLLEVGPSFPTVYISNRTFYKNSSADGKGAKGLYIYYNSKWSPIENIKSMLPLTEPPTTTTTTTQAPTTTTTTTTTIAAPSSTTTTSGVTTTTAPPVNATSLTSGTTFPVNATDNSLFYKTTTDQYGVKGLYARISGIWEVIDPFNEGNTYISAGTTFPVTPRDNELFYKTDNIGSSSGLYAYVNNVWTPVDTNSGGNALIGSGSAFPLSPLNNQLFYKNTSDVNGAIGLYVYENSAWEAIDTNTGNAYISSGTTFPLTPLNNQLFYKTNSDVNGSEGLYAYISNAWTLVGALTGTGNSNISSGTTFPANPSINEFFYKLDSVGQASGLYIFENNVWTVIDTNSGGNAIIASDTSFPASPQHNQLHYKTVAPDEGLYMFITDTWVQIDKPSGTGNAHISSGSTFPVSPNQNDLFYKVDNVDGLGAAGLYMFDTVWNTAGSQAAMSPRTITATGDADWTVTFDGSIDVSAPIALKNRVTAGTFGGTTQIPVITVNAKGLIDTITTQTIAASGAEPEATLMIFEYDAHQRVSKITSTIGVDTKIETFTYNSKSLVTNYTNNYLGTIKSSTYQYDNHNNVSRVDVTFTPV